jgi:hypothetical protein
VVCLVYRFLKFGARDDNLALDKFEATANYVPPTPSYVTLTEGRPTTLHFENNELDDEPGFLTAKSIDPMSLIDNNDERY